MGVQIYNPQYTTSYLNNDFIFYCNFVFWNNLLVDSQMATYAHYMIQNSYHLIFKIIFVLEID